MSFNLQNDQEESGIMAEINMTPMVDVMLVLLIIFIITLPVIQQAVKVELPKANSVRNEVSQNQYNSRLMLKVKYFGIARRLI